MAKLLEIKNLRTYFYTDDGVARSVDGISYDVDRGETLGVVGESGCGKSVTALSIMAILRIESITQARSIAIVSRRHPAIQSVAKTEPTGE